MRLFWKPALSKIFRKKLGKQNYYLETDRPLCHLYLVSWFISCLSYLAFLIMISWSHICAQMGNALHFEYSRMLGSRPIFCICCWNLKNARGNVPHFLIGPKIIGRKILILLFLFAPNFLVKHFLKIKCILYLIYQYMNKCSLMHFHDYSLNFRFWRFSS